MPVRFSFARRAALRRLAAFAAIGLGPCVSAAFAQDNVAAFYKGKTVTIMVGTSAGGGYDTYARLLARHYGKYIPGNPGIIIQNMPGAGSNRMAGYVANVAPKDGTVVGAPFATQPLARVLLDKSKINYDPAKLAYLGTATDDTYLCAVRSDAKAKTFKDAFEHEIVFGGTAETGSTGYLPVMLANVLGVKFKVVFGYPGSQQIMKAVEQNEIQGMCGLNWSTVHSRYWQMFQSGLVKIFVQDTDIGHPEADKMGIPKTIDFAKTDEQRRIMKVIYSQARFARPYFVSGAVPADRVAALRKGFMQAWNDKDLRKEADKLQFSVAPMSGEEIQKIVAEINDLPDAFIDKVKAAIKKK
ncbi:MAG: Bug family tripartite tricarboxylate transporter substrate binding protein [Beijerinckiaceae bacterium]